MSRWEIRRTGPRRYELVRTGLVDRLILTAAGGLLGAGAVATVVPPVLAWARAHAGLIVLAATGVVLLVAGARSR